MEIQKIISMKNQFEDWVSKSKFSIDEILVGLEQIEIAIQKKEWIKIKKIYFSVVFAGKKYEINDVYFLMKNGHAKQHANINEIIIEERQFFDFIKKLQKYIDKIEKTF